VCLTAHYVHGRFIEECQHQLVKWTVFKLSSYGDEKISAGRVKLVKDLNADIKDRHIIIVE